MFLNQWKNDGFTEGENAEIIEGRLKTSNVFTQNGLTVCEFSASDYLTYRVKSERRNRKVSFINHGWGMHAGKVVDKKPEKPMVEWYSKNIIIHQH